MDKTISRQETRAIHATAGDGADCTDEDLPEFWMDMCPNMDDTHTTADYVNLQLNPERWTGYNGSHVWSAIYDENCLRSATSIDDMCYEERVLYRLLSGMHASVNIHIALKAKPPKRGVPGREKWSADPRRFMEHYGSHPERLRNLHFSFVVLLRALRKAAPALASMDMKLGQDGAEDAKTEALMRRLLDTHILSSCSAVFGAFDESLLFKVNEADRATREAAGGVVPVPSLKSQFKGVFHNISEVMDCISCQKCKLHGKLQLLGLGTALKVLLLPEHLHAAALSRSEVVALVNTVAKFSHAILSAPQLAKQYYAADDVERGAAGDVKGVSSKPGGGTTAGEGGTAPGSVGASVSPGDGGEALDMRTAWGLMDQAVGATSALAREGVLSSRDENALVDAAVGADPRVLVLARHYAANDPHRFAEHALRAIASGPAPATFAGVGSLGSGSEAVDAVVVGGGLAGLTAALTLLDRGARVVLLEKEGYVGGNSQWASSGINGVEIRGDSQRTIRGPFVDPPDAGNADSVAAFTADCERSSLGGGEGAATGATMGGGNVTGSSASDSSPPPESVEHIPVLTAGSVETLTWLRERVGVDLSRTGQLGGHSFARTHRPASGMAGSTLVLALQKACDAYKKTGALVVRKRTKATEVFLDEVTGSVRGVRWSSGGAMPKKGKPDTPESTTEGVDLARAVILATGGFANDREGEDSLLRRHAPGAVRFATTNTRGTTGDGHKMAFKLGAAAVDLANVQIHPTGFVDPADPGATTKTLAAEILRGAGALLLTRDGRRFADELGTRDYVSGRMLAEAEAEEAAGGVKAGEGVSLDFVLLLNDAGASEADKHVPLYTQKGLLTRFDALADVATWMTRDLGGGDVARGAEATTADNGLEAKAKRVEQTLRSTLAEYNAAAASGGRDPLTNKTYFNNAPFSFSSGAEGGGGGGPSGGFYAGRVTPVVHYTMGGVRVDALGRVVREGGTSEDVIPGLYAAGEIIGGVHGRNRLGGNALTECAVFGRIVGNHVPLTRGEGRDDERGARTGRAGSISGGGASLSPGKEDASPPARRPVRRAELATHASAEDCWVAVYGEVYDFTDFLEDHPAGAEAIVKYGGTDGTAIFDAVHSKDMLDDFTPIGPLVD